MNANKVKYLILAALYKNHGIVIISEEDVKNKLGPYVSETELVSRTGLKANELQGYCFALNYSKHLLMKEEDSEQKYQLTNWGKHTAIENYFYNQYKKDRFTSIKESLLVATAVISTLISLYSATIARGDNRELKEKLDKLERRVDNLKV